MAPADRCSSSVLAATLVATPSALRLSASGNQADHMLLSMSLTPHSPETAQIGRR